jgi:hypothetical protein
MREGSVLPPSSSARPWIPLLLAILCLGTGRPSGAAAEDSFRYRTVRTHHLRLVYCFEEQEFILPHLARCFENSFRYHQRFFSYTPSEEVTIYLNDTDDYGYAGTTTIPNNWITLGIEPFESVYETCPTNERMNWVMNHELVHVVASDQTAGFDKRFRSLFRGKVSPTDEDPLSIFYSYLTNPRRYAPRWYHEGLAVFMETWMAGGIGRALGGYDEMVFRTMVLDSCYFYDVVGLESEGTTNDFQIGQNSYLYGTRFVSYLAYRYGPEKVVAWARRGQGSQGYFSSQFKQVYGVSLDAEWSRWIAWEHAWQRSSLASLREYPVTPERTLRRRALGSVSRAYFDPRSRQLYAAVNYPGEFAHLAAIDIDSGASRKICDIPTPALYYVSSVAYDDSTGTLFYTTDNSRSWRDLNAVDVATGRHRLLLANNRTGDLAFCRRDRSLWGVQHHNGRSRLVRLLPPYDDWLEVMVLPYGKDLFDLDVSPDGRALSGTLAEISGRQWLIRLDVQKLLAGEKNAIEFLHEFQNSSLANFVFSRDGRRLYGTSYYTGVSNVFRYDLQDRTMEAVTNCETGYFRPIPVAEDSLIVFRYTGEGLLPVMIADTTLTDINPVRYLGQAVVDRHPVVKEWMLGTPLAVDLDSVTVYAGDYGGLRDLRLNSLYPIAEGYKEYPAFGVRLNCMDPVGLYGLDGAVSYTPNDRLPASERTHLRAKFRHYPWTLDAAINRADFYDFFGPTKISRKGYSLGVQYERLFFDERPRSLRGAVNLTGYGGLERLPDFQNVATSFDNFLILRADLRYKDLRRTIGSIEAEKGLLWSLVGMGTSVRGEIYPRVFAKADFGVLLPLDHSSLWLRTSAGHAFGNRAEPFANFFFGGFGNNWVDHANVDRYREYYSFPGVELNEVAGRNYGKGLLEWTLPPVRFRRFGVPALYATWARAALFSGVVVTNLDSQADRRELYDFGAQLNVKLVIFSSLESTFSLGHALAAADGARPQGEWMVSLKILR